MKDRPRASRLVLIAAMLFVPVCGAGFFVGRSMGERPPTQRTTEARSSPSVMADRRAFASCQQTLAAMKAAPTTLSADKPNEDAGKAPTTLEELETELRRCTSNELLVSAEICSAAGRQFEALMALPKDGLRCGPKSRAADLIEENFERCAVFATVSPTVRSENLTKEQSSLVAEAIRVRQTLTEDELLRRLKEFVYTCTETPPKLPPGVKRKKADP